MIWTALKSYFACAWSAFTYLFAVPTEKHGFWANRLGFADPVPAVMEAWDRIDHDPSFHNLKNLLVEWTRADPHRAAKMLALFGCLFAVMAFTAGVGAGLLF